MKNQPFKIEYRWSIVAKEMRPFLVATTPEASKAMEKLKGHADDFSSPLCGVATKIEQHEDGPILRLFRREGIENQEWVNGVDSLCTRILDETK